MSGGEGRLEEKVLRSERKGRPQYVLCYRARDETGGLELEEQKARQRSAVSLVQEKSITKS